MTGREDPHQEKMKDGKTRGDSRQNQTSKVKKQFWEDVTRKYSSRKVQKGTTTLERRDLEGFNQKSLGSDLPDIVNVSEKRQDVKGHYKTHK